MMLKTTPGVDLVLGGLPARVDSVTEPTPRKDALPRPALLACVLVVSPEKESVQKNRWPLPRSRLVFVHPDNSGSFTVQEGLSSFHPVMEASLPTSASKNNYSKLAGACNGCLQCPCFLCGCGPRNKTGLSSKGKYV